MLYRVLAVIFLFASSPQVIADDDLAFLCKPEASAEFRFSEVSDSWEPVRPDVSDVKYLIEVSSDDDKKTDGYLLLVGYNESIEEGDYVVRRVGENEILYWCDSRKAGSFQVNCEGIGISSFAFEDTAGRYVRSDHGSYIRSVLKNEGSLLDFANDTYETTRVADKGGDSPVIEIGKCNKIDDDGVVADQ